MDENLPAQWNKHYTYDHTGLWEAEVWKDKYSTIGSLARWIEEKNNQLVRDHAKSGKFVGRTDGSRSCHPESGRAQRRY